MKFGIQFQLQTPRPYDADSWGPQDEARIFAQALEQIEHADRLGFDYVFLTEHHFLEEYCHSAAPEVVLAAGAAVLGAAAVSVFGLASLGLLSLLELSVGFLAPLLL